jgi:hypothetical protein
LDRIKTSLVVDNEFVRRYLLQSAKKMCCAFLCADYLFSALECVAIKIALLPLSGRRFLTRIA